MALYNGTIHTLRPSTKECKHELPLTVRYSDEIMELIRLGMQVKYGDRYMNFKTNYWKNGYNMITKIEVTCEKNIIENEELILDK